MSIEEAILQLKDLIKDRESFIQQEEKHDNIFLKDKKALEIALNLIEKQQKEIEELKKDNNHQWEERCRLTFDIEKNIELLQELLKEE